MATNRGAVAWVIGGLLWAFAMVGHIITHGPGSMDREGLWLGFSRPNYTLLLTPAALLISFGLTRFRETHGHRLPRTFGWSSAAAITFMLLLAMGNFFLTAEFEVGEHFAGDAAGLGVLGAVAQMLGMPVVGLALTVMSLALWRSGRFRADALVLAPLAVISLVPWQAVADVPGFLFGLGWIALGGLRMVQMRRASALASL